MPDPSPVVRRGEAPASEMPWGSIRWLFAGPGTNVTFGYVELAAGAKNPLMRHPNCDEVLYLLEGELEHSLEGERYRLGPGDAIHIPRGAVHDARNPGPATAKMVVAYDTGDRQIELLDQVSDPSLVRAAPAESVDASAAPRHPGGLEQAAIVQYVADTFAGVDAQVATEGLPAGDTFFIYDPERNLEGADRFPFATIVTKDYGEFDNASNLDRPDVWRLNVGVGPGTYRSLFGAHPRPGAAAGGPPHDYTALDRLMPHPVYASQSWVSVLNPSAETFERVKPLLAEAYEIAVRRLARRSKQS